MKLKITFKYDGHKFSKSIPVMHEDGQLVEKPCKANNDVESVRDYDGNSVLSWYCPNNLHSVNIVVDSEDNIASVELWDANDIDAPMLACNGELENLKTEVTF